VEKPNLVLPTYYFGGNKKRKDKFENQLQHLAPSLKNEVLV